MNLTPNLHQNPEILAQLVASVFAKQVQPFLDAIVRGVVGIAREGYTCSKAGCNDSAQFVRRTRFAPFHACGAHFYMLVADIVHEHTVKPT
ncbi:MAG: hypothetical protein JWL83_64 [Actinomycetia bacterium]|nr:hypothetical protein [Actinomycetes bacterium]